MSKLKGIVALVVLAVLAAGPAAGVPALKLRRPFGPAVTMQPHSQPFGGLAFSPDGQRLAGGAPDGAVWVWDASTGKRLFALPPHAGFAGAVCFNHDGTLLASAARAPGSADEPGEVRLSDGRTGKTIRTCARGDAGPLAFNPDGTLLAGTGGHRPALLTLWETASGKVVRSLGEKTEGSPVAFSPDGTKLAGIDDLRVTIWDVKTGKVLLRPGGDLPVCVAFSPDGARLAAGGFWGEVWVWDATTGKQVWQAGARGKVLVGSHKRVAYLAFTPDGAYLVTAGHRPHQIGLFEPWAPEHDGEVKVFDAQAGNEQFAFKTHVAGVGSACLSADGTLMAASTLAIGPPVRIWSLVADPLGGRGAAQDGAGEDAKWLQGSWLVDPALYKDVKDEEALNSIKAMRVIFVGDTLTLKHPPGNEEKVSFHLDATKKPKQIDLSEGVKGIYQFEGDTLELYWDKQAKKRGRPSTFPAEPPSDPDLFYLLLKREK